MKKIHLEWCVSFKKNLSETLNRVFIPPNESKMNNLIGSIKKSKSKLSMWPVN